MAQISEFSLILLGMGVAYGHLTNSIVSAGTVVGLITIVFSSYFITYNHQIYKKFKTPLEKLLPNKKTRPEKRIINKKYDVIVFGCHRTGGGLVKLLKKALVYDAQQRMGMTEFAAQLDRLKMGEELATTPNWTGWLVGGLALYFSWSSFLLISGV